MFIFMPADRSDSLSGNPATQYVDPSPQGEPSPAEINDDAQYVVGGETISGRDLREGRLRHSDYTRKTQTLAGERRQYEAAAQLLSMLQTDPQGTLAQLAQHYGVQGGNEPSSLPGPELETEEEDFDPRYAQLDERVNEHEAFVQQQLEQQAEQYMAQQMEKVHATAERLGLEVDEEELFSYAFQNNFVDPLAAFLRMHADDLPERAGRKAVEDFVAKRNQPIHRLSLNRAPTERAQPRQRPRSIREAFGQAMDEAGVDDVSLLDTLPLYRPQ